MHKQSDSLPEFQKIQQAFSSYIRNPEYVHYDVANLSGALPIEERRLKLYESLFFNNINEFFSNQFPVLYSVLGEERWEALLREYMVKHRAQTPLFHELGQEFLLFLQNEYEAQPSDFPFIFELAHYEWVEVALAVATEIPFTNDPEFKPAMNLCYELSPLAWPLSYEWPVNQISADFLPKMAEEATTLLVYRDTKDKVHFMALSPLLYHLIVSLDAHPDIPFEALLVNLSTSSGQPLSALMAFAEPVLDMLYSNDIIRPISST